MENKEQILESFAKHLTKIRESKGMSIRQLAAAADLEYSQVQRIEKAKVNLAITTIVALSQGLEVPLKKLMDFEV